MDSAFPALLIPLVIIGLIVANYIAVTLQERKQGGTNTTTTTRLEVDLPAVNDPEFLDALAGGNKIAAIKRYRELTNVGLKEAKDIVEYIEKNPHEDFSYGGSKKKKNDLDVEETLPDEGIRELLRQGNRIEAINTYRQFTGSSLSEAKEAIERIEIEMNSPFEDENNRLSSRR